MHTHTHASATFEMEATQLSSRNCNTFIKPKYALMLGYKRKLLSRSYIAAAFLMPHKCLHPSWTQMMP